jgi:hypothetical protein
MMLGDSSVSILDKKVRGRLKIRVPLPIEQVKNREMNMGIAPIPGIRALPSMKAPQGDFSPPEIFEIEGAAKPGDGDRQRGGRKASGAEENDQDDVMLEAETESGAEAEGESRQVDYFA